MLNGGNDCFMVSTICECTERESDCLVWACVVEWWLVVGVTLEVIDVTVTMSVLKTRCRTYECLISQLYKLSKRRLRSKYYIKHKKFSTLVSLHANYSIIHNSV